MNAFKQCSMRKHDVGNRTIFVMDGLFEEQFIRMIHHFMSHLALDIVRLRHRANPARPPLEA